jgi:hypothetical protein
METALALRDQGTQLAVVTPTQRVMANVEMVKAIGAIVRRQYVTKIKDKDYLTVAGCQVIGSGLGYTTGTTELVYVPGDGPIPGCWKATVAVYDMASGRTVGQGVACVFDDERPWNTRPQFARQGMAQTRATGRALKGVMGYAFALVGVEQSFAEEMPEDASESRQEAPAPSKRLPAPSRAPDAPKGDSGALREARGVCAGVEAKVSKAGKAYWRIGLEQDEGGVEWFTSFKEQSDDAIRGKSVVLSLKAWKDGVVVEDLWEAVDPAEVPF